MGLVALLAVPLGACSAARPVGDFERARPSFTNDTLLPAVGGQIAAARGEPVSNFAITDQEREMHDRVWRFLIAPHAQDWGFDGSVELQRTRIYPPRDTVFTTDRYYRWLKETTYQSSRTRYATVGEHITLDIQTIPETFAAICAVIEIDRQRALAHAQLGGRLPAGVAENLAARKAENDASIAWFVRALTYRTTSYNFALDSLIVETPHEQSIAVDEALRRLSALEQRARRHDFCSGESGGGRVAGGDVVIPSRYQHSVIDEVVFPK